METKKIKGANGSWEIGGDPFFDEYSNVWKQRVIQNGHSYEYITGRTKQECVSNAQLYAAAPDLLNACKLAKTEIENGRADQLTIDVLEEAINKALGK